MPRIKYKNSQGSWVDLGFTAGKDGKSVISAEINDGGELIFTLTDGSTINAGIVRNNTTNIKGGTLILDYSEFDYDGTSKFPTVVSFTVQGKTLVQNEDFLIIGQPQSNIGEYSFVIYGINKYGGSLEVEWSIVQPSSTCFGVVWNYGTSSPALVRLTAESDPNEYVTNSPNTEPTACIGSTEGSSVFDGYMPWAGIERKNYTNEGLVDFTGYDNGETYVYIPKFYSKIVNDTEKSKMYFYIASNPVQGFTLHKGSGRYVARYQCNNEFKSAPGTNPKVNTNLTSFRNGITAIDNYHFQYDIHTYNALQLLYIVEWANLNTQSMIGAGITSGSVQTLGQTDILTYHTGRVSGTDNVSAVQYRWIENPWGNVWDWIDGILIQDGKVYICNDETLYASSITNSYNDTGIVTPTSGSGWLKTESDYNNQYIFPKTVGGSDSTYLCDNSWFNTELRSLYVGGYSGSGSYAGLFSWRGNSDPGGAGARIGGRAVLVGLEENN